MLHDAKDIPNSSNIMADICIAGAGAAGITIAREFAKSNHKICLLESGGLEFDASTQSLYKGENIGIDYWPLDVSRLRYFGGTTNHWGGVCLPFDEDDFEKRAWVNNSGWPFKLEDIIPYYRRAQPILELGKYNYEAESWSQENFEPLPFEKKHVVTRMLQTSPPTLFGQKYHQEILRSSNIETYLHANVLNIETDENAANVTQLNVASSPDQRFSVRAKVFILALGGIENARLLLLSKDIQKSGLGNQNDLVGRYFADHPYFNQLGFIVLTDSSKSIDLYRRIAREKFSASAFLTLPSKIRREQSLLTSRIHLGIADWDKYSDGNSALDSLTDDNAKNNVKSIAKKLYRIVKDLDDIVRSKYDEGNNARLLKFGAWTELVPNPESRVTLGKKLDAYGQQQVKLDWRIGQKEKESLIKTLMIIASELGHSGLGRMKIDLNENSEWPWKNMTPGLHHMGTTRMHTNPNQGVVDKNCKVHGLSNLYITGSSVFPTFGHANPTLTIIALALRLTEYLKIKLK